MLSPASVPAFAAKLTRNLYGGGQFDSLESHRSHHDPARSHGEGGLRVLAIPELLPHLSVGVKVTITFGRLESESPEKTCPVTTRFAWMLCEFRIAST